MNFDTYTKHALVAIETAQRYVREAGNPELQPLHLLFALLEQSDGLIPPLMKKIEVDIAAFRQSVHTHLANLPHAHGTSAQAPPSKTIYQLLERAEEETKKQNDEYTSTEHILLAMCSLGSTITPLDQILEAHGITYQKIIDAYASISGGRPIDSAAAEQHIEALKKYCIDLTARAKDGKIDPVIGRDDEIRRVIQVLARRTKNNPVLIGEPGVGKTAIVEGLAQRIVLGDIPETLHDQKVLQLDIAALVAGSGVRGMFEERLKSVVQEIIQSNGKIILFIDELHTLVGAGEAQGGMDASNMLKPSLARGELRAIGATTLNEYRQYIEKDAALERRFQTVLVPEPSVEDTVAILRGLKEKYEVHHGVRIRDEAIIAAATLSDRYISMRFLPDKAVDLIDEAASRIKIEIESQPEELDRLERRALQLKIEIQAIHKDTDPPVQERLAQLKKELHNVEEQRDIKRLQWANEKKIIDTIRRLKQEIEQLRQEETNYEHAHNLEKAAEIKHGMIPHKMQELERASAEFEQEENPLLREEVSDADIARVVSLWTGIPVSRMMTTERQKLLQLEERLATRVIGQPRAIEVVSDAIRRNKSGMIAHNRPIGTFLFLGPTGVGKTELAKVLAETLFDSEKSLVRIDMSEYMERHAVARLIGAPPGYVGYEQGGQLTEAVRRRPYTVLLLDEIEKAHTDIFNILLQLLDEGRLTDGQGRVVDFRSTIIIMTGNVGAEHIIGAEDGEDIGAKIERELVLVFRPEFLNRLDEVVIFNRLTIEQVGAIFDLEIMRLQKQMAEQHCILIVDDSVRTHLAAMGYNPQYGARPLKRVIQTQLMNPLARLIIAEKYGPQKQIKVTLKKGELHFA